MYSLHPFSGDNISLGDGVDNQIKMLRAFGVKEDFVIGGLLIGFKFFDDESQVQHFHIVNFASTPLHEDEYKYRKLPTTVEEIKVEWFEQHIEACYRMLPGGLSVIGVYFVTKNDIFSSDMIECVKILENIRSQNQRENKWLEKVERSHDSDDSLLVIHLNRPHPTSSNKIDHLSISGFDDCFKCWSKTSKKSTSSSPETGNFLSTVNQTLKLKWSEFRTNLIFDTSCNLTDDELKCDKTQWCFDEATAQLLRMLTGVTLIDHVSISDGTEETSEDETDEEQKTCTMEKFHLDMIVDSTKPWFERDPSANQSKKINFNTSSRFRLYGKMYIYAYVSDQHLSRVGVEAVYRSLIIDALRSFSARLFLIDSSNSEIKKTFELSRRIRVKFPNPCSLTISEYLYSGETAYDAMESIEEVMSFRPRIEDMDDEIEEIAMLSGHSTVQKNEMNVKIPLFEKASKFLEPMMNVYFISGFLTVCLGVTMALASYKYNNKSIPSNETP